MYKILYILLLSLVSFSLTAQLQYNPSAGTVSNKPYSPGAPVPTDSRTMLYDPTYFLWRPYVSKAEVLSYLYLPKYRTGQFDIVINTGGVLNAGIISGGTNEIWFFKNGTSDSNLVLKNAISSVNGQVGTVITKNADSLKSIPVDTGSVARNNYYLVYDSTNRKFVLIQPTAGYVPGTGISIISNIISAQNTSPIWNANQLRGRTITTAAPTVGSVPTWSGTQFDFIAPGGAGGIVGGYISADTLYLASATTTIAIPNMASKTYVDSVVANISPSTVIFDPTFSGLGTPAQPIKADTVIYYATITMLRAQNAALTARIDSIVTHPSGGSGGGKTQLISNSTGSDSIFKKINDSLYAIKKPVNGANTTVFTTDSTFGFNATPGSAEVNTDPFTLSTTGNRSVTGGRVIDYIEVNPVSDLMSFKMGTASDDDAYIYATPCAGGRWTLIECFVYFPSNDTVYFTNITSSTQIKIHYQIQHE